MRARPAARVRLERFRAASNGSEQPGPGLNCAKLPAGKVMRNGVEDVAAPAGLDGGRAAIPAPAHSSVAHVEHPILVHPILVRSCGRRVAHACLVLDVGESVIKRSSPLNVLKGTYDHCIY
jgi:hypothetical protein